MFVRDLIAMAVRKASNDIDDSSHWQRQFMAHKAPVATGHVHAYDSVYAQPLTILRPGG